MLIRVVTRVIDPISRSECMYWAFCECRAAARGVGLTGAQGKSAMSTSKLASSVPYPCYLAIDSLHIDKCGDTYPQFQSFSAYPMSELRQMSLGGLRQERTFKFTRF